MIRRLRLIQLRNAEHFQFMTGANGIYSGHRAESQILSGLYDELDRLVPEEEKALAVERDNAKIKEKGVAERYRDKLHSKLFNSVKAILYDENDPFFDAAQRVMTVIKSVGNPRNMAENAESAMLTTLGNKLEPYRTDMETIGAQVHLDKLLEANTRFILLETECRDIVSARSLANVPSVKTIRQQIDTVYRNITDALNVFIKLNGEEPYKSLIADINTLVDKYEALLAQRQGRARKQDAANEDAAEQE
jgi:ElaB/YqjD/DUF883 family membrane-anchored ribosome-binding protein